MSKHPELIALGKQIRDLRKSRGFSQESFADHVGLDRSYIGSVERGERNISTLNLIRIARSLNVTVGDLFPNIS